MRITRRPIGGAISDTATLTHQMDVGGRRTSCAREPQHQHSQLPESGPGYDSSHGYRYEPSLATALVLVPDAPRTAA